MEDLIFSKLQKGDTIYTLERDRRSGYPIFDTAKVLKVGESKPRATGPDGSFTANTEISIQDSVSAVTIYLPTDAVEGIYNNVLQMLQRVFIIMFITLPTYAIS